jgi:SAM-dependent methyltransferase
VKPSESTSRSEGHFGDRKKTLVERLDERLYPGVPDNWDDELFRERILSVLRPDMTILDVGAGAGLVAQMDFKGRCARVVGIDPDERIAQNPHLDEAHVGFADSLPFEAGSFDLVFSDNVLEHLDEPERVFSEIARVLKPGGRLLVKTPNRLHYVPAVASLTPHAFHRFFNALRGRPAADTFPTRYRANTPSALRRLADGAGLSLSSVELIESRPEYLRFSPLTYWVGWLYERLVNGFASLARFRVLLVAELVKPPQATASSSSR